MQEILKIISEAGVIGLLIVIVWTGLTKKWVFGWYAEEIIKDRDEWKEAAKSGTYLAKTAVNTAESVMTAAMKRGKR